MVFAGRRVRSTLINFLGFQGGRLFEGGRLKPVLHVRRKDKHKHKYKHKKPTYKPVRRKHKRLVLALVFMLASFRSTCTTQRRKHKHEHKRMERFHSLVLVLVLASLRRTCKLGRRKYKYKRKERKLKNSDKLSAYILVTHALPFAAMLESNLALNFYASALAYVTL